MQEDGKTAGSEYLYFACRGFAFVSPECASWLLDTEEERPLNIISALKGLFPILTGREPPFEEDLDWLQFTYAGLCGACVHGPRPV